MPQTTVVDPEATQVHQEVKTETVGNNSYPGAVGTIRDSVASPLVVSIPPKAKSSSMLLIGGVVLIVLLIGGGIGAYFLMRSKPATGVIVRGNTPTPAPTSEPDAAFKPELIEIPGGTLQMGRNDGPPQERPLHAVTVQKFLMDRTEVTNVEYEEFVRDTNYETPLDWSNGKPLPGQEHWPVVNVSARDAEAFAAWRSKRDGVPYRLPTEEEWEFAARSGGEYKSFPWGNSWETNRAVVKQAAPRPVGSYPEGKNRWGIVDLIGNASEWTSSKASVYTGAAQIPPENKDWMVLRGGSYASDPDNLQIPISATYRDWFKPTLRHPTFGFRLVRAEQ
jgi:formylglycine-generating enzyme required for sulfatase activity